MLPLYKYKAGSLNVSESVSIEIVEQEDLPRWAHIVSLGFEHESAAAEFERYAKTESIYPYAARIDGEIAAGGTIAIHGDICDLGVTSTLPEYRGKGLQKYLLQARLAFANKQGATLATVTTEPGSISDLNIQKMGFYCAYTRVKFTKALVG